MADIDLVVDSRDLKAAIDLLNEYGMSFTGMVNKVQTEGNRLARASKATATQVEEAFSRVVDQINTDKLQQQARKEAQILKLREQSWKQFFQSYNQGISASQSGAPSSASGSILLQMLKQEEEQARLTAKAAQELAKEKNKLTSSYNPLLAAEQQYLKMQQEIHRASEIGVLDAKQQASALQQLDREYEALGKGVYLAGSRFNQFGEMAGVAGRSAGRFGMYAQQAGYQIGDFAVQLQSGANAGVAFSQQAAQLAGLIPGLAGAVTTFGAIGLGLVIQNLTRSKEEAEQVYAEIEKFRDFENIFEAIGASVDKNLFESISKARKEYGDFVADMANSQLQSQLDQLKENLSTVLNEATAVDPKANKGFFSELLSASSLSATMGPSSFGLSEEWKEAQASASSYNAMLGVVEASTARLFDGTINSQDELVDRYVQIYEEIARIPGVSGKILDRFQEVAEKANIWQQVQEKLNTEAEATLATVNTLRQQLYDISGIDISGVFSTAQSSANSLLGTVKSLYTNMAAFTVEQNNRIQKSVQSNPLDPLGAFSGGQSAAFSVQTGAGGVIRSPVMPDWVEPKKGGSGGKGGRGKLSDAERDAKKAEDRLKEFYDQFNLHIKQQERLLGVYGDAREEVEKIIEIENRLGEARILITEKQIEAAAREELALEQKLHREEEIYNLGNQSVENLLMTIVKGTDNIEDAFKGMLSSIVAEVYSQYVAKGAADMAGNFLVSLFSANGNAFAAGGAKFFAKGGVVDSATPFKYSGGLGVMGEAGPEAIMPLKRNSQGKLGVEVAGGNSSNVNINHYFNISANGDESVVKIIDRQLPRITEASRRAVADAQRRSKAGFR